MDSQESRQVNRRICLMSLASGLFAPWTSGFAQSSRLAQIRGGWQEFLPRGFAPPEPSDAVSRTEQAWRRLLEPAAFRVLREGGTERAGSSPLNEEHRVGVYVCAGCDLPVFTSEMKYDSGTGWPSFFTTIPNVFETQREFAFLIPRTKYHCVRCRGHHGHVFDDGPPPTNERWCNNGVALRFVARDAWSSSAFGSIADEQVDQRPGIT
jgi:peptide-methionine (R)-S-oxide reductase